MAKMKMCASGEDLHLQVEENKVEWLYRLKLFFITSSDILI
jgi:hypothetical protein